MIIKIWLYYLSNISTIWNEVLIKMIFYLNFSEAGVFFFHALPTLQNILI